MGRPPEHHDRAQAEDRPRPGTPRPRQTPPAPTSLNADEAAAVLGAPAPNDLNDIAEGALEAVGLLFPADAPTAVSLLDPTISPVAGSRAALVVLAAALIRQVTLAPSSADDLAPAIDVVTSQAGDHVCLEISRVGVDVGSAAWPLADLCRFLCRFVGGQVEMRLEREEMTAAVRLPAVPWSPVAGEVWVLDDEPVVRDVIERILSRGGLTTRAFGAIEELEACLDAATPSLLLIEATLGFPPPRGGTLEWLARVHPELIERTVLLTTNPAGDAARRALAALRRSWYLAKPFTADTLLALVRRRLMCLGGAAADAPR